MPFQRLLRRLRNAVKSVHFVDQTGCAKRDADFANDVFGFPKVKKMRMQPLPVVPVVPRACLLATVVILVVVLALVAASVANNFCPNPLPPPSVTNTSVTSFVDNSTTTSVTSIVDNSTTSFVDNSTKTVHVWNTYYIFPYVPVLDSTNKPGYTVKNDVLAIAAKPHSEVEDDAEDFYADDEPVVVEDLYESKIKEDADAETPVQKNKFRPVLNESKIKEEMLGFVTAAKLASDRRMKFVIFFAAMIIGATVWTNPEIVPDSFLPEWDTVSTVAKSMTSTAYPVMVSMLEQSAPARAMVASGFVDCVSWVVTTVSDNLFLLAQLQQ